MAGRARLLITVHGIRTFGHWQERLEALVREREPATRVLHYKYGYFSCAAFLVPPLRWLVTRRFRAALVAACRGTADARVDVVAHSFGTHLVAWALHGLPADERPRIHTLVLAGSVLKPSFPWDELTDGCVGRVVNDCGTEDAILVLNQGTVLFTGMAGRVGFAGMSHERFRNRFFAHGHSGYFLKGGEQSDEFMRAWWVPVLCGEDPIAVPTDPRKGSALEGLLTFALNNSEPVKVALFATPLVLLALFFFHLYREAEARTVQLLVANGQRASEDSDPAAALLWYAEALGRSDERAALDQRVRYAMALRQMPRLSGMLPEGASPSRPVFSPDGKLLAIAVATSESQGARVWDLDSGDLLPLLPHGNTVHSIAFAPAGNAIATGSDDCTARVWNARTGEPASQPLEHRGRVTLVRFSPDGTRLVTVESAGSERAHVWDARSGEELGSTAHASRVEDASFRPDGEQLVTIEFLGRTSVWDARAGGEAVVVLEAGSEAWLGSRLLARFSPDGARIATSNGAEVEVWDAATGSSLAGPWRLSPCADVRFVDEDTVFGVDARGRSQVWSVSTKQALGPPRSRAKDQGQAVAVAEPGERPLVAVADADGVRVWADGDDTPLLRHTGTATAVALSADGKRVASVDVAGVVRVYELGGARTGAAMLHLFGPFGLTTVSQASFSPSGGRIVTVSRDPWAVDLWDAETGEHEGALGDELAAELEIEWARFSPDGARLLTGDGVGEARLWDALARTPIGAPMTHPSRVTCGAFSPDGRRVVTGCDGLARVWSAEDGGELLPPSEHSEVVAVGFSPDGETYFVAGGAAVRMHDAATGEVLPDWSPPRDESGLTAAALSPDGRFLATGGADGVARVWDARSGLGLTAELVHAGGPGYANQPLRITSVAFSSDSRRVASSSRDTTTRVWDARTGAPAGPFVPDASQHAAFAAGGRWIATAGVDGDEGIEGVGGVARVSDVRTGLAITPPLRHLSAVLHVEFSPDERRLVTAGMDGVARVWDLTPDERSLEDLRTVAELLAARRLDETAGIVPLSGEELGTRWRAFRASGAGR